MRCARATQRSTEEVGVAVQVEAETRGGKPLASQTRDRLLALARARRVTGVKATTKKGDLLRLLTTASAAVPFASDAADAAATDAALLAGSADVATAMDDSDSSSGDDGDD